MNDTGSVEVQCAVLTARSNNLTTYFKTNHKDFTSRRVIVMLVRRCLRLLNYVKGLSVSRYLALINHLGIRKKSVKQQCLVVVCSDLGVAFAFLLYFVLRLLSTPI